MNDRSRTENSAINIAVSICTQFASFLLSFYTRTMFIRLLGTEYLGVNGLYSNILSVLSLADLGMDTAMLYTLYKPIVEKNKKLIAALIMYYKKIYMIIALIITCMGICILPALKYIVNAKTPIDHLELYFVLILANSVSSYLFAYKRAIVDADQKGYIIKTYNFAFTVLRNLGQILILLYIHSYIAFLVVQLCCTLLENYFIAKKVDKVYPLINENNFDLMIDVKKSVFTNIKAMFVYKLGGVILNSTVNIIISTLLGTIWVGYYSNYSLIVGAIITITGLIFSSITSSVGNLNASDSSRAEHTFKALNFMNFWVYGFSSVALYVLVSDFVYLWLGQEYVLDKIAVIAMAINVYMPGMLQGVSNFRDTTGLFRDTKYVILITAALNLMLSIVLGSIYGLAGILLSTAVARGLTTWWYEPHMLYRNIFKSSSRSYFKRQLLYGFIVVVICLLFEIINIAIREVTIFTFLLKLMIVLLTSLIPVLVFRNTDEFAFVKNRAMLIFMKIRLARS